MNPKNMLEGLCHRQLENSTHMKNAWAPYHFDQIHRKEPKSYSKLKAMVTNFLEDHQEKLSESSETNRQGARQGNSSRVSEKQSRLQGVVNKRVRHGDQK